MTEHVQDIEVAPGIRIHPHIMSGSACIAGRRIPTSILRGRFSAGDSPEFLADDYDITLQSVYDALRYEFRLHIPKRRGGLKPPRKVRRNEP